MIEIRPHQMRLFEALAHEAFSRRCVEYLRSSHTAVLEGVTAEELTARVGRGITAALARGLSSEAGVVQFIELGLIHGEDFHRSPQFAEGERIMDSNASGLAKSRALARAAQNFAPPPASSEAAMKFDPARAGRHFSAQQAVASAVVSAEAVASACCLQTSLRLAASGGGARTYVLTLPVANGLPQDEAGGLRPRVMEAPIPAPFIEVLAGEHGARLVLTGRGPAECPPGRRNEAEAASTTGARSVRNLPFAGWEVPLAAPVRLAAIADLPGRLHPCSAPALPPAVWAIAVPGCRGLQAMVAVFPDIRWEGGMTVRAVAAPKSQSGFELAVQSTAVCRAGGEAWTLSTWAEALAVCPWLGCVEMLGRCVASISTLRSPARVAGLENPALRKRPELAWSVGPQCSAKVESALHELVESGRLGHRLALEIEGQPLLAGQGEIGLLGSWLDQPSWSARLAPLLTAASGSGPSKLLSEMGLWLAVDGRLTLRVRRQEDRPQTPPVIRAEARGAISMEIEGRSTRVYEGILVRAGGADDPREAAGITLTCQAPPPNALPDPESLACRARLHFSGLAVRSVEKLRPGVRLRPLVPTAAAVVLPARSWPAGAVETPGAVPWRVS